MSEQNSHEMVKREMLLLSPVMERELRVQARASGTYWLRVVAGLALTAALGATLLLEGRDSPFRGSNRGPWLLALLHTSMCFLLAAICPLMVADTLARERREGTMGILLLTPLRPGSIVAGKVVVHLIRAFTIWLAIVPVLTVPVLLGGVGAVDITFSVGIEFGIILASLAAGLVASSLARLPGGAMALAMVLTLIAGECLALVSFLGLLPSLIVHPTSEYAKYMFVTAVLGPWLLGTGLIENGFSGILGRNPAWLTPALWTSLASVVTASVCSVAVAHRFASIRVQRLQRVKDSSPAQVQRQRFWLKPRLSIWHRHTRRSRLRRNPILWLYTNHPLSALRRWGWAAVAVAGWALIFWIGFDQQQNALFVFGLPVLLVAALALAAASGFRRDLEERTLELLLVTPIPPASLVKAQVLTLWRDFFPAVLLSTGLAGLWNQVVGQSETPILAVVWSSFLTLPAVGSRLAVRNLSPLIGWLWTLMVGAFLPSAFALIASFYSDTTEAEFSMFQWRFFLLFAVMQVALAAFCAWCTITDLVTRRFQLRPLQRAAR